MRIRKNVVEPVTDTVKQSLKTIGAVVDTSEAIELKGEETNNAINKKEDLIKYAINFDLLLTETLSEVANSETASQFQLRVNLISRRFSMNKNVPIALHRKSLIFIDSNKKFDLEVDVLEMMMTNYNFMELSIERTKDEKLLLDLLDEIQVDVKHTGNRCTREKSLKKLTNAPANRAGSLENQKSFQRKFYFLILMMFVVD